MLDERSGVGGPTLEEVCAYDLELRPLLDSVPERLRGLFEGVRLEEYLKFCARYKAELTTKRTPVDSATKIPGEDAFSLLADGEQLPESGILVSAKVLKGAQGVFEAYQYTKGKFEFEEFSGTNVHQLSALFDYDRQNRFFDFAYEAPDYSEKDLPPDARTGESVYMGLGWNQVRIASLSGGGRLITQSIPYRCATSTYFHFDTGSVTDKVQRRAVLTYHALGDLDGAASSVEAIATRLIGLSEPVAVSIKESFRRSMLGVVLLR